MCHIRTIETTQAHDAANVHGVYTVTVLGWVNSSLRRKLVQNKPLSAHSVLNSSRFTVNCFKIIGGTWSRYELHQ